MGERLGEALLDIDTDDRKFNQGVDRAERKAVGLGRTFDDTSRRAVKLGKALAATGAIGITAFAAGIAGAIKRLEEMRKYSAQIDQALKNSGNTARTSAKEIEAWADALENRTGRAAEEVMAVSANLASFGFGREEFYRAIALADDMSAAWGGDLRQNLEGLSRALDDPINGMAMLSKRGVKLTDDQKAMAQAFLDANDKIGAQGVVFDALEAQVKGVAEAGFGGLSAAIAQAQKRWEEAFEDLVTGKGDAGDLRDTLVDLADTLSSPEFIAAAMGFGAKLVEGINLAAEAVIWTWGKVKEFLAWLDGQNPANNSVDTLQQRLADERENLRLAEAGKDRQGFSVVEAALGAFGGGVDNRIAGYRANIAALEAELAKRGTGVDDVGTGAGSYADMLAQYRTPGSMAGFAPVNPYEGMDFTSDKAKAAAEKQSQAVRNLIADLEHERDTVGLNALDQEVLNAARDVGVDVMSEEGLKIRALITETAEHRAQLERMEEIYGLLGDIGKAAITGLVDAMKDGQVEGSELLGILGNVLSMAGNFFLNQAFGGMGGGGGGLGSVLGSLFSGFFADGGLIPNGSFGIVGEAGPEPVIGTPQGARVLPNSSLADVLGGGGGGDLQVIIQGSGLTQAEMTQAIADAIDRFDRFQLPGRVSQINADPLARG